MNRRINNSYRQTQTTPNPFYQSQYGSLPGYTVQGVNYPNTRTNPISPFSHRSPWLIGLGIIDIVISDIMFVWTVIINNGWSTTISIYITLPCAIFHLILGIIIIVIVSILGCQDGIRHRNYLIATLVIGIVGPCIIVCAALAADVIEWVRKTPFFADCLQYPPQLYRGYCFTNITLVFAPIVAYSLIQVIVCVILSSISYCYECRYSGYCSSKESSQQPLMYMNTLPPYFALAVPQAVPYNPQTYSDTSTRTYPT